MLSSVRVCYRDVCARLGQVVLDLLARQESVSKQQVFSAAALFGLSMTDTWFTKSMEEICECNGALWSLKTPP